MVRRQSSESALFQITAPAWSKQSGQIGSPRHRSSSPCTWPQDSRTPCSQVGAFRRGRQRRGRPSGPTRRVCTSPKLGAVRVTNRAGCSVTRVGHTLAAAQSGGDQLVGVAAVALRAGRADRLAAVPARLPEHPVGLAVGRPHPPPALAVARLDPTAEQDGTGAVARGAQLRLKSRIVRPGDARDQPVGELRVHAPPDRPRRPPRPAPRSTSADSRRSDDARASPSVADAAHLRRHIGDCCVW